MKHPLAEQVEQLRRELAALRHELATEVRTRRLVVVDADGCERVYTNVPGGRTSYAQLRVMIDAGEKFGQAEAVLQASSEVGSAESYVYVGAAGTTVGTLFAIADESEADAFTACEVHGSLDVSTSQFERPRRGETQREASMGGDLTVTPTAVTVRRGLATVARAHFDYVPPA